MKPNHRISLIAALLAMFILAPQITLASEWEYLAVALSSAYDNESFPPKLKPGTMLETDFGYIDQIQTEALNKLGKDGWELVTIAGNHISGVAYLKRPRQPL